MSESWGRGDATFKTGVCDDDEVKKETSLVGSVKDKEVRQSEETPVNVNGEEKGPYEKGVRLGSEL